MAIITIGILAHVDAGKTSLTERILFETGIISEIGSVDRGTTRTDSLELERSRGITIQSAVVSFWLNTLKVNLVDTPGHVDFVAEVERSLRVLDAVVLVISAVEGVQSHTRRLVRAVRAIGLPMIIFINKTDRAGARPEVVLADVRDSLRLRAVSMDIAIGVGGRSVAVVRHDLDDPAWREVVINLLAETDEGVIASYERGGGCLDSLELLTALRSQIAEGTVIPVYSGSAITGAGVPGLLAGIEGWLPRAAGATGDPLGGTIFKVARRPSGEKIVYARLAHGELAIRQRVAMSRRDANGKPVRVEGRVTGIERFEADETIPVGNAGAGEIVILHGLRPAKVGDLLVDPREGSGDTEDDRERQIAASFPPPTLESVIRPVEPRQITPLREALEQLADQDPLIALRQRDDAGQISLKLFGEVQKEVIGQSLVRDYGIEVAFGLSQTICIERPTGTGERAEVIFATDNPFYASVGFRVEPAARDTGIEYHRELGSLPLAYYRAIEETVHETLTQGLCGWEVTDCVITLFDVGYCAPVSTAADFRKLVPLVLMGALADAGTAVCEPVEILDLDIPADTLGAVGSAVVAARGTIREASRLDASYRLTCVVPTAELGALERRLPPLTRGEAGWSSRFAGYEPVPGAAPRRDRVGPNPLIRAHYLAEVARS